MSSSSDSDDDIPLSELVKKKKNVVKKEEEDTSGEEAMENVETENDSDSDDEPIIKKVQRKRKKAVKKKVVKKAKVTKKPKKEVKTRVKKENKTVDELPDEIATNVKKLPPLKKLELTMKSFKWWEHENNESPEIKWRNLEQSGVMFPPAYKPLPKSVKLYYDSNPVTLTNEQEEVAYLYAAVPLEGPQLKDAKTAKVFNKNFFKDFKVLFDKQSVIKSFDKLDFKEMRKYIEKEREKNKLKTKEVKEKLKLEKEKQRIKYTFAVVDGNLQKVGNVMVEPPGLFKGRGAHPKTGTLKKRVMPEQITINVGEDEPIPPCPIPGHSWGGLVHKHEVTWLAYWKENVMDATKYVWLAGSSSFKGKADREKYEKARRLKKSINKIRADYEKSLKSSDEHIQQRGCAMWVIDRLALRVGNEKDDDEADTVGCCSLRVEHIILHAEGSILELDFLGKDSMRHHQKYELEKTYGDVGKKVYKIFEKCCKGKNKVDQVFHKLDAGKLNDHLKKLLPGLSAKVFRTYNASFTLEQQLPFEVAKDMTVQEKMILYNAANREVAILCNHQRSVSKAAESSLTKLADYVKMLEKQKKELLQMMKKRVKKEDIKLKTAVKIDKEEMKKQAHLFAKQPSEEQMKKRIQMWTKKIKTQKLNLKNKNDNKTVALGTSKINYCDPRISVAWAKRNEVPIEKIFPQALQDKFPWAMSESTAFKF